VPKLAKSPRASFFGGPLDGQTAPCFIAPHDFVAKSTLDDNGATRRWHWYKLVSGEFDPIRYEFVKSETGDWPSDFCNEEGE